MKSLTNEQRTTLLESIRDVEDFPKKGIIFKDITTLLNNSSAYKLLMDHLKAKYEEYDLDFVAGIESRGFIFGATLANMLGVGFVPIRKKGKLPYTTIAEKYSLEYGVDEIEVHIDAFRGKEGSRVLLIDDLIATGGTAEAAVKLINQTNAKCVEACFLINLSFLEGVKKVESITNTYSVLDI